MCKPTLVPLRHVVISGAGPAGLLLAALLLQRNQELPFPLYRVTLIDNRQDLGQLPPDVLKKQFRSWMLGLAGHGVAALKQVDNERLWKEYCEDVGIPLQSLSLHLGSREIKTPNADPTSPDYVEGFIVDRNFIVASLARYLNDFVADDDDSADDFLTTLYDTKVMYVDYDNQRILTRPTDGGGEEVYIPYDLLVGCDGARSVVREALVKRHSTFEMDVGDIFQCFKAVHVQRPPEVDAGSMHLLPDCFPCMQGIALPETGDMLNISIGVGRHLFDSDKMPLEIKSDDPKVVAKYFQEHFKAFGLIDYEDLAEQWVNQRWNRTAQVHCNFYHSTDINVVIMGDAAHATSPSIGMGMNQALKDAQTLYLLLQQHKDDFSMVLPAFSETRVKEGNSLTDLAMNLYCFDTKHQLIETLHMVVRSVMHKVFPKLILNHPQNLIGRVDVGLAEVYDLSTRLNIVPKHRRINDQIRQEYFEQQTGMVVVTQNKTSRRGFWQHAMMVGGLVAGGTLAYSQLLKR